jgi:tRNA(fMet)-specific endonuclease VapC
MSDGRLRVLDTDTLSLIQRGRELVTLHLLETPLAQRAVTIITVEEQLRGRLAEIRRAAEGTPQFVTAYARIQQTFEAFRAMRILLMDASGTQHLASLRAQRLRLSTQDLRIAAIALSFGGVLVTCNTAHFSQVPGLQVEDWSRA